jgi:hypothetical protein
MRSALLALMLALSITVGLGGHAAAETVLTVTGRIGEVNRGPYNAFHDAFIRHNERPFERAFAFTREALKRLPQKSITAKFENWPTAVTATGPSLADALKVVGAPAGAKLTVIALDGYAAEFEAKHIAAHDWIIAIQADGKPLGIGGRGPTWMMFDTAGKTLKAEEEALWVWSAFMIVVD